MLLIEQFNLEFGILKKDYAINKLKELKTDMAQKKVYTVGHSELILEINDFTDNLKLDKINIEQMDSKLDDLEKRAKEYFIKNHKSHVSTDSMCNAL